MTVIPQHMEALERANAIRLARAVLKRDVRNGSVTVAEVLQQRPWEAEAMTIGDLLTAQGRWGRTRTIRFLNTARIGESKLLRDLTDRQRGVIVGLLNGDPVDDR